MTILLPTENDATNPGESPARPPDASMRSSGASFWALIDRSDDALLDFYAEASDFDIDRARALLAQHPATYRNHLMIAKFIEGWIARITNDAKPSRFNEGFVEALLEMTDHLRDGDFAVEPSDEVGDDGPSQTTDIAATNGDLFAAGHAPQSPALATRSRTRRPPLCSRHVRIRSFGAFGVSKHRVDRGVRFTQHPRAWDPSPPPCSTTPAATSSRSPPRATESGSTTSSFARAARSRRPRPSTFSDSPSV